MQGIPTKIQSVVLVAPFDGSNDLQNVLQVTEIDSPPTDLQGREVLVEIYAVSLGTPDINALKIQNIGSSPGFDFAGIVRKCHSGMWKEGDRVAGMLLGGLSSTLEDKKDVERYGVQGSCSTYCRTQCDLVFKVPDIISFEGAATLPSSLFMSFQAFNFPSWPYMNQAHEPVLILGAGTSLGLAAVQIGSLCGRKVIAVCDSNEQSLVKGFGAEITFDYLNPDLVTKVLQATQNSLSLAMDCSFKEESLGVAAKCIGSTSGGTIAAFPLLLMGERHNAMREVSIVQRLPPTVFGFKAQLYGQSFHPQADEIKHTHAFFRTVTNWIAEGKIRVLPSQKASQQGINGLVLALQEIKNGGDEKVGGKRLVSVLGVSLGGA